MRIPGGPVGGQYHGYIASDDMIDGMGWPAGHDETFRPIDNKAGLGAMPWQEWDTTWGGIPLAEGETVSDFVYRSTAELRPRPNASGGTNVVSAAQTRRSAGYAVAPGNYKALGAIPFEPFSRPIPNYVIDRGPVPCPAWGCGGPPRWGGWGLVNQPTPPFSPAPAPTTGGGCPSGQYQDAAGNCTSDWRNPYVLYLPQSPAPAPTVNDPNVTPPASSGSSVTDWLSGSTSIAGANIPNWGIAAVAALAAVKFLGKR